VLYISYNGVGTPLVRSQVLPYLRALAPATRFVLLAYEQGETDRPTAQELDAITVRELPYHKRPRLLAKLVDAIAGAALATWLVVRNDVRLLHARSHVPAAVAAIASAITRRPFIFDMRGFLAEEFAEAGSWRQGGLTYRLVDLAERMLLRSSAAVVVLTERARDHLRGRPEYAAAVRGKPVVVVPCCVEIERFSDAGHARGDALVYIGSVGTWYLLDEMLRFFEAYRRLRPAARFVVANRGQHPLIERSVVAFGMREAVTLTTVAFDAIPALLMACTAGIVLLTEGGSKLASSPIKVAEYLAAGLPVVVNEIVGDTPELLRSTRAGVVLDGLDAASLDRGAQELVELLAEGPTVRERARALARSAFDARDGARRYGELYDALLAARRVS